MSTKEITYYTCDVCEVSAITRTLPGDWSEIYYGKSWSSGTHKGTLNEKFHCCDVCLAGKTRGNLFKKILRLREKIK